MSKTIFLEVRDRMTFIPVMVVSLESTQPERQYLLERGGYGGSYLNVHVIKLNEKHGVSDPFEWSTSTGRTMKEAHIYIRDNFHDLKDGDVIDIEFIKGETTKKKKSERL